VSALYLSDFLCVITCALSYSGTGRLLERPTSVIFFVQAGYTVFLYSLKDSLVCAKFFGIFAIFLLLIIKA
jgi:hypothetical protein